MCAQRWRFRTETGYFEDLAALAAQCPNGKLTTQPQLALLSRKYPTDGHGQSAGAVTDWQRFAEHVRALNRDAPDHVSYKVLYVTRHGYGYHNAKHAEVGDEAWHNHWALVDGDEHATWFDSFLNDAGIQQVRDLSSFWIDAVDSHGVPLPQTLYTSPLARTLQTTDHVFGPLMARHGQPFRPVVKERLRERRTLHTCDYRRTRTWIQDSWPGYALEAEAALPEEDPFRALVQRETDAEHVARKHALLEDVFSTDGSAFVSLTAHRFAIAAMLEACNAAPFKVREGVSLAMLVRGERLDGSAADRLGRSPDEMPN